MLLARKAYLTQLLFDFSCTIWGALSDFFSPILHLPPLVLRIRITNRCNLACSFCYVGNSLNKKNEHVLNLEEWTKIIHSIPRYTLIDITGGEPFLTPHFKEIIELMLLKKLKISLITNGTVAKPHLLEMLVLKKLHYFMVSLDGTEAFHDKIRGDGTFQKSIQTLKEVIFLKKKNNSKFPLVVCKVNLTADNAESIRALSHYLLEDLKIDGLTFNLLFTNEARDGFPDADDFYSKKLWSGNTMIYPPESIELISQTVSFLSSQYQQKITIKPEISNRDIAGYLRDPSKYSPTSCFKYRSVATLYFDGKMTPCDLGIDIGNIREINYDIRRIKILSKLKEFFHLFKLNNRTIPGCAGCCLKTQELVNEI